MRARTLALSCALLVASVGFGFLSLSDRFGASALHSPTDFVAFYCAGKVAAAGRDPYRSEPLRSCERDAYGESHVTTLQGLVVPAPLPGYALAFFALFASLPFRVATLLWALTIGACSLGAAALMQRLTALPIALVFLCFLGADFYGSIVVGQLVPVVVLALCSAGAALAAGRQRLSAVCAAGMLLEPHLALPACVALAVWRPRTRGILMLSASALALISVAFLGVAPTVEYVTRVLPAQARGEGLAFYGQYSLSAALHVAGAGATSALAAGSLSYIVMVVAGVALAGRAVKSFDEPALLVFVPVAFALFGGAYVHIYQMAAALPLALVLVARLHVQQAPAFAALVCLAIPWQTFFWLPAVVALFPAPPYIDPAPLIAAVDGPARLAEDVWTQWMATASNRDHRTPLEILAFKLPTWFGLATLIALVARATLATSVQPGKKRLAPR